MPRGFAMGRGRGSLIDPNLTLKGFGLGGFRTGFCRTLYGINTEGNFIDKELQKQALKNRAELLQSELQMINNRLNELESQEDSKK